MEGISKMKYIAHIETDFPEKFGIPRQSGLVKELQGRIIFEPEFRNPEAVKGLEGFNYIWILWEFEGVKRDRWSATVKPPRLGGNKRMGVFATRSPFRPNPIGLSSVKLERIEMTEQGPVLHVSGADLKDQTAIYDIKPYLPYADCHPDAKEGFAHEVREYELQVTFPEEMLCEFPEEKRRAAIEILKQDPRPSYHDDPTRRYGVSFAGKDIHFTVKEDRLTVFEVVDLKVKKLFV
jgi:tRNA-Thr(GGU) m(6)t(6)A37 methyltransferase TsaA